MRTAHRPLTALTELNLSDTRKLTTLWPLASLTTLTWLNLSGCSHLTDLSPLASLTALTELDLSHCEQLTDLFPLANLTTLNSLVLRGCEGLRHFAPLKPLCNHLTNLELFGCYFDDLPVELCGEKPLENVVHKVRAYYADLSVGATPDTELKRWVLGNGGVGKTQVCRRLQGLPFDHHVPSTHGIQPGRLDIKLSLGATKPSHFEADASAPADPPTEADPSRMSQPVRLHLWDFGGQDI